MLYPETSKLQRTEKTFWTTTIFENPETLYGEHQGELPPAEPPPAETPMEPPPLRVKAKTETKTESETGCETSKILVFQRNEANSGTSDGEYQDELAPVESYPELSSWLPSEEQRHPDSRTPVILKMEQIWNQDNFTSYNSRNDEDSYPLPEDSWNNKDSPNCKDFQHCDKFQLSELQRQETAGTVLSESQRSNLTNLRSFTLLASISLISHTQERQVRTEYRTRILNLNLNSLESFPQLIFWNGEVTPRTQYDEHQDEPAPAEPPPATSNGTISPLDKEYFNNIQGMS